MCHLWQLMQPGVRADDAGSAPEWSDDDDRAAPTSDMADGMKPAAKPATKRRAKPRAQSKPAKRVRPAAGAKRTGKLALLPAEQRS